MFYEVKAIARAKIKRDKRDSEVLAHLLRMNTIPEVYRRSTENRQAQRVLRQRAFYVSAMTALKNRVHAFLAQQREEIREVVAREINIFSSAVNFRRVCRLISRIIDSGELPCFSVIHSS